VSDRRTGTNFSPQKQDEPGGSPLQLSAAGSPPAIAEMEMEREKRCRGLHPESMVFASWTAFMVVPIIFTGTVMPYRLAFMDFRIPDGSDPPVASPVLIWASFFVDVAFVFDMLVSFFAGYYDYNGDAVTDLKKIRTRYLHTLFVFDLIACLPPEVFMVSGIFGESSNANKVTRLPRVARLNRITRLSRLIRLGRMSKFVKMFRAFNEFPPIHFIIETLGHKAMLVISAGATFFLLAHICACLWYLVTALTLEEDGLPDDSNWLDKLGLREAPPRVQWVWSVYFIYTVFTTVGFGDVTPTSPPQIIFVLCMMLIGVVINSWIVSNVISIVSRNDHVQVHVNAQKRSLRGFMGATGLSETELEADLAHWVEYHSRRQLALEEQNFTGADRQRLSALVFELPRPLLHALECEVYGGDLRVNKFFAHSNTSVPGMVVLIAAQLRACRTLAAGEFVYEPGAMPTGLYFITEGLAAHVAVATPAGGICNVTMRIGGRAGDNFEYAPYILFSRHNYFGEWELIFPHPRSGGVRAERTLSVHLLPRPSFVDIASEVPQLLEHFRRKAARREARRTFRLAMHTNSAVKTPEDVATLQLQLAFRARARANSRKRALNKFKSVKKLLTLDGAALKVQGAFRRKQMKMGSPSSPQSPLIPKTSKTEPVTKPAAVLNGPSEKGSKEAPANGTAGSGFAGFSAWGLTCGDYRSTEGETEGKVVAVTKGPSEAPSKGVGKKGSTVVKPSEPPAILSSPSIGAVPQMPTPRLETQADKVDGATGARITKIESDVADMKHTMGNLDRTVKDMQLMLQQIYLMSSRAAMESEEQQNQKN
jgi:CRP-like cAMP-binding protein